MFKSGVSEYSVCLCEVCMFPALLMLPDSKYNITVCIDNIMVSDAAY